MTDALLPLAALLAGFILGALWQWGRIRQAEHRRKCENAGLREDWQADISRRMVRGDY